MLFFKFKWSKKYEKKMSLEIIKYMNIKFKFNKNNNIKIV